MPTSPTSRAWTFSQRGNPSDILNITDRPLPSLPPPLPLPRDVPQPEEWLLIKVAFAGLNVGAIFQMTLIPPFVRSQTCIPEMDLSGIVLDVWHPDESSTDTRKDSISSTSQRFHKGDKIVAMLPASHTLSTGTGALAQHIIIPARYAVHKPASSSFADAAGCLLTGMTAYQQVIESSIKAGDRVLVNAASGGIGTMVVQMARRVVGPDGYVVGISSGRNTDLVRSLGADQVIDYTLHPHGLPTHLKDRFANTPFNAVIDTLGHQSLYLNSPSYLTQQGVYSSVGIKPPNFSVPSFLRAVWQMKLNEWWPINPWLGGVGRLWRGVSMMEPSLEDRQRVVRMLGEGEIRVVRDSVWSFDQAKEAYAKLGGLHARGKVMVKVDETIGDDEC